MPVDTLTYLALFAGARAAATSGATLDAVNPATGEVIAQVPRCGPDDVAAAVAAADRAGRAWRRLEPAARAACIHRLADAVEADQHRLVDLEVADNGTPRRELELDLRIGVNALRYFAGLVLQVRGETVPVGPGRLNYTLREPFGVVARILPFNHPLMFALARLAPPLLMGNTLIVKPSEHTSLSALALADHIEAIFPPGVVSVLTGLGSEVGDAIVAHPGVRRIAFIGSLAAGLAIQRRAASDTVKTVTLELGGKSPLAVFADADPDTALEGAITGMRLNLQGQACGATTRLLLQRDIHDEFLRRLAERVEAIRVRMPEDPEAEIGALVSREQFDKVLRYIELGRQEGAEVLAGGGPRLDGAFERGRFMHPTLLAGAAPDSRVAQEEIFGPVLLALPFDDYDDAIRLANGVRYGLTASVYTGDLATAHAFASDVDAGYVWVNENQRHFPGTSYGGVKDSGLGREEDVPELESYTQVKNVHVAFGSPAPDHP